MNTNSPGVLPSKAGDTLTLLPHEGDELSTLYRNRFASQADYRRRIWRILVDDLFAQWIHPHHSVLDLGSGHGEFINSVLAASKWAMDLNPDAVKVLSPDIHFLQQNCAEKWPIPKNSLDIIFTSNFFEHLPTKALLRSTLEESLRALRPGGRLIAMGPNIRFLPGAYWDFWDHYLPLTERSLAEAGILCGFEPDYVNSTTLPYSMSQGFSPPTWCLKLYLRCPFLWKFLGKQFIVVLRKPQ